MKYLMIMQFALSAWKTERIELWPPGDAQANMEYLQRLGQELRDSGELIDSQGLGGPETAVLVHAGHDAAPVVTDGPFAESKEFMAGFWAIDVDSPRRAHDIAARVSAMPGPGGKPLNVAIEVRPVMHGPHSDV